ncbi:hypothetical protein LX36DRAFT_407806 [Colletotrichum falcatum]|nr:hypothetical protein LX36DRAFT_407806 [Colletotrichum falcatum]
MAICSYRILIIPSRPGSATCLPTLPRHPPEKGLVQTYWARPPWVSRRSAHPSKGYHVLRHTPARHILPRRSDGVLVAFRRREVYSYRCEERAAERLRSHVRIGTRRKAIDSWAGAIRRFLISVYALALALFLGSMLLARQKKKRVRVMEPENVVSSNDRTLKLLTIVSLKSEMLPGWGGGGGGGGVEAYRQTTNRAVRNRHAHRNGLNSRPGSRTGTPFSHRGGGTVASGARWHDLC